MNSNHLKLIAITAMTMDHLAWIISLGQQQQTWYTILLHIIGRITAPIMWFFIVEGYHHTHNLKKYLIRLFSFAIISHFAYCFAFGKPFIPNYILRGTTSIMWPLAWSVALLAILDSKIDKGLKIALAISIFIMTFSSDWGRITVPIIVLMHKYRGDFKKQMLAMMLGTLILTIGHFVFVDSTYGILQLATWLAVPILYFYNGEKGKLNLKYLFYIYYPLHLTIIGIIRLMI